ncbi:MAG: M14 family metallopeptidase, partial [Eubacteriales bacterium]
MTHNSNGGKKLLSAVLTLSLALQLAPVMVSADDEPAVTAYETTGAAAVFKNVSENGEDMISLSEPREYKAMIPVDSEIDPAAVVWTMTRNENKPYNDAEKYPNQLAGGALTEWVASNGEPFFSEVTTTMDEVDGQKYVVAQFSADTFFTGRDGSPDYSAPHSNGGSYLDVCGWFNLTASVDGEELGSVEVKITPYDDFHTMAEVYDEIDAMVDFAAENTSVYAERFSMGLSSGEIYEPMDMPYIIIADDASSVADWLEFTEKAETEPTETLADISSGVYDDLRVPVMYSNIHANEVAATDGIIDFAWSILEAAAGDGVITYNKLTGLTEEGEAELAAEMEEQGMNVPDLIADMTEYLGFIKAGNKGSGVVDLDKYYTQEEIAVDVNELLKDVFFIIVPEENVEGREYITRTASNGYDLNRDNSFQTTEETQNMQKLIGTFNPVSFTEFHGRVTAFQCEPCDPPHEPNFEYDLLAEHLIYGGEALGIAAVANNDTYNSYVIPQRDYLYSTVDEDGNTLPYWEPWDDMSTSYTPQFAMLHGTVSYTVELPGYNDAGAALIQYGCLGQSDYIASEKLGYITAQVGIFERGVTNANSDAYELVGQWFTDQYDTEGAEMDLFRPEFDGEGQNGNFYPECYIIPLDAENQTNLQAANDMMEWLSRNDVKVLVTESEAEYNGVTYPAGTMVISMYQAKRSVANGALYDGTLIQQWSDLYSEGITTFGETRGFDVVTVAEPAAYEAIKAVCGEWMDYESCLEYLADVTSAFTGKTNDQVIISNASEDSTAAVNALLKAGETVGMVTDESSEYYADFVCSYDAWLTVADKYILTGTGISYDAVPGANVITKAPSVYVVGTPLSDSEAGFIKTPYVTNANWNYDRLALEMMNFDITKDAAEADAIIGASAPSEDEIAVIKAGTPYIGYGSRGGRGGDILGEALVRESADGMDCLAYVTYPTTTLVNASYVMDGDDVLYGYGVGYYTVIPE